MNEHTNKHQDGVFQMSDPKSLPKSFAVNKELSKSAAKRDSIANEGFVKVVVVRGDNGESPDKDFDGNAQVPRLMETVTFGPLRDPNDLKSVVRGLEIRKKLVLPARGPSADPVEDAEQETLDTKKLMTDLAKNLRVLVGPELIPFAPRKQPSGNYEYDGEVIEAADYEKLLKISITKHKKWRSSFGKILSAGLVPRKLATRSSSNSP
jgi:hypothetical protein